MLSLIGFAATGGVTRSASGEAPAYVGSSACRACHAEQFEGWSGDVISTSNPISITMTGDVTVTATFKQSDYEIYLPLVVRNG